ncbi:MAG: alpha/beta fold hydrolase [Proteobacteria bacterium]|nr:alpha/beta fold hydrolase [Pseudomonadota bacterium]
MRLFLSCIISSLLFMSSFSFVEPAQAKEKTSGNENPPPVQNPEKPLVMPTDLPEHWKLVFKKEPVFNSKILVAETGDPSKSTILLIHGLGQVGLRDWLNVIPALEKEYHVLALDLPGFGHSAIPKGQYSPTNYARVLHWLKEQYRAAKIKVVGHSMGAAVSLKYASEYPNDLDGLVLVDAAGILSKTAFVKHNSESGIKIEDVPGFMQPLTTRIKSFASGVIERISQGPDLSKGLYGFPAAWNLTLSNKPNINAALALMEENFTKAVYTLNQNTALIWGVEDSIAPLRTGKMLQASLLKAKLFPISGAGHVPMKSHPKIFNQLLLKALSRSRDYNYLPNYDRSEQKQKDIYCRKDYNKLYQGNYDSISLIGCNRALLRNVQVKNLHIRNSIVEMENVVVNSPNTALDVINSVLTVTNSKFRGNIAIHSSGSRLDFAGVLVDGKTTGINTGSRSRIVFSISKYQSPSYSGYIHGNFVYKHTVLDPLIDN